MLEVENSNKITDQTVEEIKQRIIQRVETMKPNSLQDSINASLEYVKSNPRKLIRGEARNVNSLIFEMNEFYMDMVEKLKDLRFEGLQDDDDDEDVPDNGSVLSEVVGAINKHRNDPAIKEQIEKILNLDEKLERKYVTLRNERKERKNVQNILCEMLSREEPSNGKSQVFLGMCQVEETKKSKKSIVKKDENEIEDYKTKPSEDGDNNSFINRNKKLAKNTVTMGNCSLTDEEKLKIEKMLDDGAGDQDEENDDMEIGEVISKYSEFLFNDDDRKRLDELEGKLQELGGVGSSTCTLTTISSEIFDKIDKDEQQGKFWKHDERLKQIEEELKQMQIEKDKENLTPAQKVEISQELIDCQDILRDLNDIQNELEKNLRDDDEKDIEFERIIKLNREGLVDEEDGDEDI